MNRISLVRAALAAAMVVVCSPAFAQMYEAVGIRAQGMGGAFVAIADDASATWWNPAGLASGTLFSGILERRYAVDPSDEGTLGTAFSVPSLGVSYYRLRLPRLPFANTISTA